MSLKNESLYGIKKSDMDDREFEKMLALAEQLRLREQEAESWTDRYSDMNSMEKSMLLDELFALRKADKEERDKLLEKLDRMSEHLLSLNENSQRLLRQNEEQQKIISDLNELVEKLQKENASLKEQKKLSRESLYGSKSQKLSGKKDDVSSHEENKGDFDGTSGPSCVCGNEVDTPSQSSVKTERPYRKGVSYKRMKLDNLINSYDIDNSIAERFIRPLAGERKNSLFFTGSRMANVSAAYHTLLSTCRMNGLSALEYLKKFFREVVNGRRDYENLLPTTIGLSTNKH